MESSPTTDIELEVVEIEAFAREGKPVPKAKRYRIRVDRATYEVDHAEVTGREILTLAGKTPDKYNLYQHFRGGETKLIAPDERVNLRAPGVERFTTMKIENTEG